MIEPPSEVSIDVLADWIEASALFGEDEAVSRTEASAALRCAYGEDTVDDDEPSSFPGPPGMQDEMLDLVWTRLRERSGLMSAAYPFLVESTALRRTRSWTAAPAYAFLLLCEAGKMYQGVKSSPESGSQLPKLFEYVVNAAQPGLFGGKTFRFGWPVEPPASADAPQRLQALADAFGVRALSPEAALTSADKDAGLDVCARVKLGDELPGTAFILVQCATGKNWRAKTGEPSIERWKKYIDWPAAMLRAVAVPWRVGRDDRRRRELLAATLELELAVILDRDRLLAGNPDDRLEKRHAEAIRTWCSARIAELPAL